MPYTPPLGNALALNLVTGYTPPNGAALPLALIVEAAPPVIEQMTLNQSWALKAAVEDGFDLGQRWVLPVAVEALAEPGQLWLQNATAPHEATHNQRWFQHHTVIHQTRFNQFWSLLLRAIETARFNQRWRVNTFTAENADLSQVWNLIATEGVDADLNQRWLLDARVSLEAVLNQRYWLYADVIWQPVVTAIHYSLTLTGAPDALPDLQLPMSSFQGRLRTGSASYLSVVVPGASQYSDAIEARANGQLVVSRGVRWSDGTTDVTEIARVNLESIRLDQGARSYSATLSGHRQTTNSAPKAVALAGAQVRSVASGLRRYRCALDNNLRAGDTAEINGESFTAREISYTVGPNLAVMEVLE